MTISESSYIASIVVFNILLVIGWIWQGFIKRSEGRVWHFSTCMAYGFSYLLLVGRNIFLWSKYGAHTDLWIIGLSYAVYAVQLYSVTGFIYYSITKDKKIH